MTLAQHPTAAEVPAQVSAPSALLRAAQARQPRWTGFVPCRAPGFVRRRYRSLWISDVHLGARACKAERLLEFLRASDCETLYLVGDIIDGWQLEREPYWPAAHQAVLEHLFARARGGTRVVYVTGNHDEELRTFNGTRFGRIPCVDELVHTTAGGRRLLVLHGDRFDSVLKGARWMADLGDRAYAVSIELNLRLNRVLTSLGGPELRISMALKRFVKGAAASVGGFERELLAEAARRDLDGVVCGHMHTPAIRELSGLIYCNDGDWVESCTALAERFDGRLELVAWRNGGPQVLSAVERLARATAVELVPAC